MQTLKEDPLGSDTLNINQAMQPSIADLKHPSPAAVRMRRYRDRRSKKLRCLTVEIRDCEIEALLQRGLLNQETRNDTTAITEALHSFMDQTLN